jgi:hypothetical protein
MHQRRDGTDIRFGTGGPSSHWETTADVVLLPSGRPIRIRRHRHPPALCEPSLALHLNNHGAPQVAWEAYWIRWRWRRPPSDQAFMQGMFEAAWSAAGHERVEIVSGGGGRVGTAVACLGILDGLVPRDAVLYSRSTIPAARISRSQIEFIEAFGRRQLGR